MYTADWRMSADGGGLLLYEGGRRRRDLEARKSRCLTRAHCVTPCRPRRPNRPRFDGRRTGRPDASSTGIKRCHASPTGAYLDIANLLSNDENIAPYFTVLRRNETVAQYRSIHLAKINEMISPEFLVTYTSCTMHDAYSLCLIGGWITYRALVPTDACPTFYIILFK